MDCTASLSQSARQILSKSTQDNRLPPIVNSPTAASSPRPRLPPLASIHQLPSSQSHAPRLQNVSNMPHPNQPAVNHLDTAFQRSTERMQAELVHFRAVCSRALHKEQQDKETLRMQCMSLMRERDAARETVRTLMSRSGGDGPASPQEIDFPISPISITSPTSAGGDGRQAFTYGPHDRRSPTQAPSPSSDGYPDSPGQKRKQDIRSTSADPAVPGHFPPTPHVTSFVYKKRRTSSCSVSMANDPTSHDKASFIDLMYMPNNGRLICRACILKNRNDTARSHRDSPSINPPKSFSLNASWDDLHQHCDQEHPSECADLASLSPAQLMELRRRFTTSASSSFSP